MKKIINTLNLFICLFFCLCLSGCQDSNIYSALGQFYQVDSKTNILIDGKVVLGIGYISSIMDDPNYASFRPLSYEIQVYTSDFINDSYQDILIDSYILDVSHYSIEDFIIPDKPNIRYKIEYYKVIHEIDIRKYDFNKFLRIFVHNQQNSYIHTLGSYCHILGKNENNTIYLDPKHKDKLNSRFYI